MDNKLKSTKGRENLNIDELSDKGHDIISKCKSKKQMDDARDRLINIKKVEKAKLFEEVKQDINEIMDLLVQSQGFTQRTL